jgi:hypothetical protein
MFTRDPNGQNRLIKDKFNLSFAALGATIAMMLQAYAGTAGRQCATPTMISSDATHATTSVTVRMATKTAGAHLRYTLDGSLATGGLSGDGTQIAAASGIVLFEWCTHLL